MFCSNCGKQLEPGARFCPYCGSVRDTSSGFYPPASGASRVAGQLLRPRSPRVIAGVCAAFAEHYGWDLNLVRVLTVVITLLTGVTLLAYIAAWILIPDGPYALPPAPPPPPPAPAPFTETASR
jgi:phage shock protein C